MVGGLGGRDACLVRAECFHVSLLVGHLSGISSSLAGCPVRQSWLCRLRHTHRGEIQTGCGVWKCPRICLHPARNPGIPRLSRAGAFAWLLQDDRLNLTRSCAKRSVPAHAIWSCCIVQQGCLSCFRSCSRRCSSCASMYLMLQWSYACRQM